MEEESGGLVVGGGDVGSFGESAEEAGAKPANGCQEIEPGKTC